MNNSEGSANSFDAQLAIIGPTQVGGFLSAALFGCLACQSYLYFTRFRSDGFALKAIVSLLLLLIQLGHFVCIISTLWTMTVSTYGNPSQLDVLPLAADLSIVLSSLTVFIVQSFYAFRLWRLSRSVFLPILCEMISAVAQTSMLIGLIALSWIARAVCDLITTVGVAWSLKKTQVSDFKYDYVPDVAYHFLLHLLMSMTVIMLFIFQKQNFVWLGIWLIWPNVVGNSLLASLNRRLLLWETRKASRGDAQCDGGLSTIGFRAISTQSHGDSLENFESRDGEMFQETEYSINQEQKRVLNPAVDHMSQDDETHC
ncbi:hypothetical protein BDR07DRAFT_1404677 [Suillus spraguei]|nr:hypothetical protein BDR07DRAFT_1404677 [Suillus spraguei]